MPNPKLYTAKQLCKKFAGKYIDVYPHHYARKNPNDPSKWETMYEVRGVARKIKENFMLPEDWINPSCYNSNI